MATFSDYWRLMRFDRPIGIYLLLWPTLWSLWLAGRGQPAWPVVVIFLLGVVVMRAAGCVMNDWADRKIDPHVARTQNRPLAAGALRSSQALGLLLLLACIALGLALLLPWRVFPLAVMGALLTMLYPFCKRFIHCPQAVLGMAFSWSVPMAFSVLLGDWHHTPIALWLAAVVWPVAYDTCYAMADRQDDERIGVRSSAIWWGAYDRWGVALFQAIFLLCLWFLGRAYALGLPYVLGWCVALALALYQQKWVHSREPVACFRAFQLSHWQGAAIFAGIFVHYSLQNGGFCRVFQF